MADDERRVEPRAVLVGRGMSSTPERIQEIYERAKSLEKAQRKKPEQPFAAVLAKNVKISEKKSEQEPTKKKMPKRGVAHPALKKVYGRQDIRDEDVVIKG